MGCGVAQAVTPDTWRRVNALAIHGIEPDQRTRRSYPAGTVAGNVVGYTYENDVRELVGNAGIEMSQNGVLTGTNGEGSVEIGKTGAIIPTGEREEVPARPGATVRLTLDPNLQTIAQDAIDKVVVAQGGERPVLPQPAQGVGPPGRPGQDGGVDVLEVDVVDAIAPPVEALQGVAPGEQEVARVQGQAHRGVAQQPVDLGGGLHVGGRVVVEGRLQPEAAGEGAPVNPTLSANAAPSGSTTGNATASESPASSAKTTSSESSASFENLASSAEATLPAKAAPSAKTTSSPGSAPPMNTVSSAEAADGVGGLFTTPMVHIRTPSHHSLDDICG